ncbi:MAG TPA: hypothetical protein VJ548_11065 [Azospira sp.]|nr:hypothetical protein [Azospira sp.]
MFTGMLLAALNHILQREDWARARLKEFAGRHAQLEAPPLLRLALVVGSDGRLEPASAEAPADVRICLPEHAPLRYLGRPQEALAAARIEGVADFAETLGFVFRNLRWDVEEDLARYLGDIPARRLTKLGRGILGWQRDALQRLGANFGEYVADESSLLPGGSEERRLADEIARLEVDTQRLAERIARLEG